MSIDEVEKLRKRAKNSVLFGVLVSFIGTTFLAIIVGGILTDYIIQKVIIDKENNLRSLSELFNVNNLQLLGHQNCGEIIDCIDELITINQKKIN